MADEETTEQRWTEVAEKQLLNRKIVAVRYMTQEEMDNLGWYRRPVVIQLDDGNLVWPSSDDEGNNAGSWFTNSEEEPCLPVI